MSASVVLYYVALCSCVDMYLRLAHACLNQLMKDTDTGNSTRLNL